MSDVFPYHSLLILFRQSLSQNLEFMWKPIVPSGTCLSSHLGSGVTGVLTKPDLLCVCWGLNFDPRVYDPSTLNHEFLLLRPQGRKTMQLITDVQQRCSWHRIGDTLISPS